MKHLLLLFSLLASVTVISCSPEWWASFEAKQETHILVIGDSQSSSEIGTGTDVNDSLFYWIKREHRPISQATGFYPSIANHSYGKLYVVNESVGGSAYVNEWGSKGYLYERAVERARIYNQMYRNFDFILLAVGGWDALGGEPMDSIKKEMIWVIDNLKFDFPNTRILLSKAPGGDNYSTRMRDLRVIQDSIIQGDSMVYESYDIGKLVDQYGREEIGRDSKHLKQKWSDTVGKYNGLLMNKLKY